MSKDTGNMPVMDAMSMRDYLACKALEKLIPEYMSGGAFEDYSDLAESAYNIADAMLEARK